MINTSPATKVHLLAGATDMRRSFEGLYALAKALLETDPLGGHLFCFCNKARTRLKILYWDGSGLWVCAKRLEKGCFAWPQGPAPGQASTNRHLQLTQAELLLLLNGIDLGQTRKRAWHRVEA